jgi:hypothetical protein
MTPEQADQVLDRVERSGKISREANRELIDGHLAAASVVVAQSAAMAAQGVLPEDFSK